MRIPPDYMPKLDIRKLPEEEWADAELMLDQINQMENFAGDVEAAVDLFQTCRAQSRTDFSDRLSAWSRIACRSGAMDIGLIFKCPTLAGNVDRALLKQANATFAKSFPAFEKLRHSVAHSGELSKSHEAIAENALKENVEVAPFVLISANGKGLPMGNIINDTFTNTIAGQIVSYNVNAETVKALRDTQDAFKAALDHAGKSL